MSEKILTSSQEKRKTKRATIKPTPSHEKRKTKRATIKPTPSHPTEKEREIPEPSTEIQTPQPSKRYHSKKRKSGQYKMVDRDKAKGSKDKARVTESTKPLQPEDLVHHMPHTFDQSTSLVNRISKVFSKYLDLAQSAGEKAQIYNRSCEASQEKPTYST